MVSQFGIAWYNAFWATQVLVADSDEVARAFRDDVARYSDMMSRSGAWLADNFFALSGGAVNPWMAC
jgi:hypothetical protein